MRKSKHTKVLEAMGFRLLKAAPKGEEMSDECIFFANEHETVAVDELGGMWHVHNKVDLSRLQFTDVSQKLQSIINQLPHNATNN